MGSIPHISSLTLQSHYWHHLWSHQIVLEIYPMPHSSDAQSHFWNWACFVLQEASQAPPFNIGPLCMIRRKKTEPIWCCIMYICSSEPQNPTKAPKPIIDLICLLHSNLSSILARSSKQLSSSVNVQAGSCLPYPSFPCKKVQNEEC